MTELTIKDIVKLTGKSSVTVREYIKKRNFPKPKKKLELIGGLKLAVRYWKESEVLKWIEDNKHWL